MLTRIDRALSLAKESGTYETFREAVYNASDRFFCRITCDSRETIPLTLALFYLANGRVDACVTYAANLGRDADTIASMCGAIAGALRGAAGIKPEWVDKVRQISAQSQEELALSLVRVALVKREATQGALDALGRISGR